MLQITNLDDGLELFKVLGSDVRAEILKILIRDGSMNLNELASRLNITNGALTGHIKKLETSGLISVTPMYSGHGNQKVCSALVDRILIDFSHEVTPADNIFETELKVGHYNAHLIYPTCGLASADALIGEVDDARYFEHPKRFGADILWFTRGYVEYSIPNLIPASQKISQISISAELSSEAPGVNSNWASDISFYLNGKHLGNWVSPGDFGDERGLLTPAWWPQNWNQYGLLKLLVINKRGTFVDGLKISEMTIQKLGLDYRSPLRFRMAVEDNARHVGGLTIFGKGFGNYNQDIKVSILYEPINP
ncbi:MAG: ArsR/SmtB family transcription factor [bacterium]